MLPLSQTTTNNSPVTVQIAAMTHPAHKTSVRYFFAPVQWPEHEMTAVTELVQVLRVRGVQPPLSIGVFN